ncbi:MAG: DUF3224 domain-containing protein [Solirubrobacterales bacterium]|nr:DUF3224 domain-containing protein [Solirubrobacterales bacterium]MBV9942732.1 DUF3224 domain-containing protein [Solirubrobacterales bacterium]
MTTLTGGFHVESWSEDAYDERDARRLTRASVTQRFDGDIAGEGTAQWLMAYQPDGTARFVGLQLVDGVLAGRRGTFVLETTGQFDGQRARWEATVLAGSSTGELADLTGTGRFEAPHGSEASYELEVELPEG